MNREIQRKNSRRTMSRKIGGGYGMGAPLVPIPTGPGGDWNFAVKQPVNQGFDDCLFPARPGQLFNTPNPALAQAAMAGGKRRGRRASRRIRRRGQRGGTMANEDIEIGATFYGYDATENEIVKYVVEHVEGDEVRALKHSGPMPVSVILEKVDIVDKADFDKQLQNLLSAHPGAAILAENPFEMNDVEFENNAGSVAATEIAIPESNNEAVAQTGGGNYDAIETSHAYRSNGWTQELSHGATPATMWGRDTGLAQTVMAGGRRRRHQRAKRGGAIDPIEATHAYPPNGWETPSTHGGLAPAWGPQTGLAQTGKAGGSRRQRGAGCGCTGNKLFGGRRRKTRGRRMRGGAYYGYSVDPSVSVGGSGPNVAALNAPVPCDPRAGSINSSNPQLPTDPRSYGFGYSATPNTTTPSLQAGGAYSTGNAYPDSCYKAPGSELPVYNAQTAGFNFYPSTARNGTLPDGVTPYNDVVPYAARMGGARRRSRKARKDRKGRKGRKGSRRAHRSRQH
jgi:hypothetical protein